MSVADTLPDATFRGIDPVRPANPFAKQIVAKPHALVPSLDNRASSKSVVRRSREVSYPRSYLVFMDDPLVSPPLVPTFVHILTCPPYVSDAEGCTTVQLTTARNHRAGPTAHLVAWDHAKSSSCATATRSRFYLPTPACLSGVEVPYSCVVELPWMRAYAMDDLYAGRRTPWALFRSEWALAAAVFLLETFFTSQVLWRFPPRLLYWIRSVGPFNIFVNAAGPDQGLVKSEKMSVLRYNPWKYKMIANRARDNTENSITEYMIISAEDHESYRIEHSQRSKIKSDCDIR